MAVEPWSVALYALSAGAATFFAPCAYPLLPGYLAYFLGMDEGPATERPIRRAAIVGLLVSLGFGLVYGVLGGLVALVGSRLLANVATLELVVGLLMIGLGVAMTTGRLRGVDVHVRLPERRRSWLGFLGFGVVYGVAAAACTAPIFFGVVGLAIAGGGSLLLASLGSYLLGMSLLMVGLTLATALGRDALVRTLHPDIERLPRIAGVLLALAGVVQIYLFLFRYDGLELLIG